MGEVRLQIPVYYMHKILNTLYILSQVIIKEQNRMESHSNPSLVTG